MHGPGSSIDLGVPPVYIIEFGMHDAWRAPPRCISSYANSLSHGPETGWNALGWLALHMPQRRGPLPRHFDTFRVNSAVNSVTASGLPPACSQTADRRCPLVQACLHAPG